MKTIKIATLVFGLTFIVVWGVYALRNGGLLGESKDDGLRGKGRGYLIAGKGAKAGRTAVRIGKPVNAVPRNGKTGREETREQALGQFNEIVLAGEDQLNELERNVLRELRDALDNRDLSALSRLIAEIQRAGMSGSRFASCASVSRALKKAAITALMGFGGDGIADLIGFLADSDPDIADIAVNEFERALQDFSLGDRRTAEIVVQAASVLTDDNSLDFILGNIYNMRHSVGIEAILAVYETGTEVARSKMPEITTMFTGESEETEILTVKAAEQWLKENPDGPDDEFLYGPVEDDW